MVAANPGSEELPLKTVWLIMALIVNLPLPIYPQGFDMNLRSGYWKNIMKSITAAFKAFACGTIMLIVVGVGTNSLAQAAPKSENFTGTWKSDKCHYDKSQSIMSCFNFTLYLLQTGKNICGAHMAGEYWGPPDDVHRNAGRQNEGYPGSIIGSVINDTATIVFRSGRSGEYYLVKATIDHGKIKWNVIGRFTGKEQLFEDWFPTNDILTKSSKKVKWVDNNNKSIDMKNLCNWPTFNPTFDN